MIEQLLWLTGGIVLVSIVLAYAWNRDPLHPMMYLGPMLIYIYAFVPAALFYRGVVGDRFPDESDVMYAQTFICAGIACFCAGCLYHRVRLDRGRFLRLNLSFSPDVRHRLLVLSYWLGAIGVGAFVYMMVRSGGISSAYSQPKGGGSAESGYITSAPLLTIIGMMLYLLAEQGKKRTFKTLVLLAGFISPHIIHGILSASRGTTFLALATLVFGWYLTSARRPSPRTILAAVTAIGVLMIFLKSQRREIYIGSDLQFNQQSFMESLVPVSPETGDISTYSWGLILTSHHLNKHYWGQRYAVQLFVRPIPKQLWPTKYQDTGMGDMVTAPGSGGFTLREWFSAVGWVPNAGSATGFVADSYVEFAWGGLVVCLLVGLLYSYLWKQSIVRKGIWTIVYFEACVVSVFLPTQGLTSAWAYRFIFLAAPTVLIWRYLIAPVSGRVRRSLPRFAPGPMRRTPPPQPLPPSTLAPPSR